jgi:DNA polymerase sigma
MDEYLQISHAEFPSLRPLYAATRTLLEARGLFGPANSGIGANALAVLLIAFLKMNHDRFVGPHRLGEQLLAFLHLYGSEVDLQTVGVAADPPGFFGAQKMRRPRQGEEPAFHRGQRSIMNARSTVATKQNIRFLCIQDPTQFMRNLGRSCARVAELQDAFAASHESLQRACDDWPSRRGQSQFSILAPALRANFDELENFRERVASSTDVGLE